VILKKTRIFILVGLAGGVALALVVMIFGLPKREMTAEQIEQIEKRVELEARSQEQVDNSRKYNGDCMVEPPDPPYSTIVTNKVH
jgi:hypothetical protein